MKRFLGTVAFFFCVAIAYSTHIVGGYIEVEHVTGNILKISVVVYYDSESPITGGNGRLRFGDGNFRENDFDVEVEGINGEYDKVTFSVEHTYSGPGYYTIIYEEENRHSDIVNIDNTVSTPFYVETRFLLDPSVINSSPVILSQILNKTLAQESFSSSIHFEDLEGDIIAFQLQYPKNVAGWKSPDHHMFYPNGGTGQFTVEKLTGTLDWSPVGFTGRFDQDFFLINILAVEKRMIDGNSVILSETLIDYVIEVEEDDHIMPSINLDSTSCSGFFEASVSYDEPYQLEFFFPEELVVFVNGLPPQEYTDSIFTSNAYFQVTIDNWEDVEQIYQMGTISIFDGSYYQSQSMALIKDCSLIDQLLILNFSDKSAETLLFPNPVRSAIHWSNSASFNTLKVFDLNGREVLSDQIDRSKSRYDLSMLDQGTYLIQFFDSYQRLLKSELILKTYE